MAIKIKIKIAAIFSVFIFIFVTSRDITSCGDTAGFRSKHRAEHYSRSAAAAAHAQYYAHPSLHLHSYLPRQFRHDGDEDPHREGGKVEPMNGPSGAKEGAHDPTAPSAVDPSQQVDEKDKQQTGTEGTREEMGGKKDAGDPSGHGNDALAAGGKAQGTVSNPGPTAQEVAEYYSKTNGQVNGGEKERPGIEKFWQTSARMDPHLQLLCGPLLAYYTVKDNIYQGAAMIVTNDEGSVYSPAPSLSFSYHPYSAPNETNPSLAEVDTNLIAPSTVQATKFNAYVPADGSSPVSFFRFIYEIPLQDVEMTVKYRLNGGPALSFVVPAKGQNLRWASHSCNGFSSGVNPDEFKGTYESGYDPLWEDMVLKHHTQPLHCMVGGGDQIYCDAITREPELQSWINAPDRESKLNHPLTDEMKNCIDRFYFNHYCKIFRSNAFGRANASIPMVNMLDDHDLIDGFGTYDDETQRAAVFSHIGSRGYFWFLIFQLFVNDEVDGTNPQVGTHVIKSMIIGSPGAWIPFPSHSLLVYLGPKVLMLALDCRAERKLHQICTKQTYAKTFGEVRKHKGIEQFVLLLGVPIAYPRMSFLEHFLEARWNPLNILARKGALGLGGMVNKFNKSAELLDDLNDHWCANVHKKERNWLVLECQKLVLELNARLTFLSGDVHLAAVGCLFTHKKALSGKKISPEEDYRYMLNVVTSAIVNTPPPAVPANMVAKLGGHKHRTLPHHTDEMMVPLFTRDTDGSSMRQHLVQARRNYAIVSFLPQSSELEFDFRVEKSQGAGETVSYAVKAPAPRWKTPAA